MIPFRRLSLWLCPVALAACLAPPELPPSQSTAQIEAPELLPLSGLLAQRADGPNAAQLTADPDARVSALRARAAQLRGSVIAENDQERMRASGPALR